MTFLTKKDDSCELKQSIVDCLCEAQRVLSNKTVQVSGARELIGYTKKMRALLLELHHTLQCEARSENHADAMHLLWKRFFELAENKNSDTGQARQIRLDVIPDKKTA